MEMMIIIFVDGYGFKNDFLFQNGNCYKNCEYNYYYFDNNYFCTLDNNCPLNYKLIENKKKCIPNCKNDTIYKYELNNKCYEECPINSKPSFNDSFLCEEITQSEEEKGKYNLEEKELNLEKNVLTGQIINDLTKDYAYKYGYYNNYVEKYENDDYLLYIYNNLNSLPNISNETTIIDFGECYKKIKNVNQIEKDLIITTITIKENNNNNRHSTKYLFSNPITGEIIKNTSDICANDKIIMQENAMTLMNEFDKGKKEDILFLAKQGIDVFNLSDRFYNDLCYFYKSPNNKDICMKDRISYFFPNISLCEPGCKNKGVNLNNLKVKCECIFHDFMDNELIGSELG